MFSEKELIYLRAQRLTRIATVNTAMQPDVAAARFEFDGESFFVGGRSMRTTLKYKNVKNGYRRVALVFDDAEPTTPPRPRGLKIHGTAVIVEREGHFGFGPYLHITPVHHWSWGIEGPAFVDGRPVFHKAAHLPRH